MAHEPAGAKPKSSAILVGLAIALAAGVGIGVVAYIGASSDPSTRAGTDGATPSIREPAGQYSRNTDARPEARTEGQSAR